MKLKNIHDFQDKFFEEKEDFWCIWMYGILER